MRHAKEIYIAAKEGGGDTSTNASLRLAVDKARASNMPNDNIDRAIKKATGSLDGVNYEEITYEGYGPSGVAVIVHILTDNKNRTAAEIRHAFNKNGGNLGENGSVSFMFDRKGYFVIDNGDGSIDEESITLEAIEAGAEDIIVGEGVYEIITSPDDFSAVRDFLRERNHLFETEEITLIPQNYNQLQGDEERKMLNLIEMLEDNEDVQDIYHNLELSE